MSCRFVSRERDILLIDFAPEAFLNDLAGADRERDIVLTPDPAPEAFWICFAVADFSNKIPLTLVDFPFGCRHHFPSRQAASGSTSQQANGAMVSVVPSLICGVKGIVGAVPKSHSVTNIPSAPATPPPLFKYPYTFAESPLRRRALSYAKSVCKEHDGA